MPLGVWLKRLQSPAVSSEPLLKAAKEHCFPGAVFCSLLVQIPWGLYVTCLKRPGCKQGMVCAPTSPPQLAQGWDVATAFLLFAGCSIRLCDGIIT